jgi:hypothetical protein
MREEPRCFDDRDCSHRDFEDHLGRYERGVFRRVPLQEADLESRIAFQVAEGRTGYRFLSVGSGGGRRTMDFGFHYGGHSSLAAAVPRDMMMRIASEAVVAVVEVVPRDSLKMPKRVAVVAAADYLAGLRDIERSTGLVVLVVLVSRRDLSSTTDRHSGHRMTAVVDVGNAWTNGALRWLIHGVPRWDCGMTLRRQRLQQRLLKDSEARAERCCPFPGVRPQKGRRASPTGVERRRVADSKNEQYGQREETCSEFAPPFEKSLFCHPRSQLIAPRERTLMAACCSVSSPCYWAC